MKVKLFYRPHVIATLLLIVSSVVPASAVPQTGASGIPLLVDSEWLSGNQDLAGLRIVDYGRTLEQYQSGHIPGAVFLAQAVVYDIVGGILGMLPPAEMVSAALEKAGIGSGDIVVIYDKNPGMWASRLFWALEYLGHRDVHVLDGGLDKWVKEGRAVQKETPPVASASFTAQPRPELLATKQWVLENLDKASLTILDARTPKEYTGEDVRSARGGHIPKAVNINYVMNMTTVTVKNFLPSEELEKLYSSQGITRDKEILLYCQTAGRSSQTYFVLRLLGYPKLRNYDGSWEEWGNATDTPVEKGAM